MKRCNDYRIIVSSFVLEEPTWNSKQIGIKGGFEVWWLFNSARPRLPPRSLQISSLSFQTFFIFNLSVCVQALTYWRSLQGQRSGRTLYSRRVSLIKTSSFYLLLSSPPLLLLCSSHMCCGRNANWAFLNIPEPNPALMPWFNSTVRLRSKFLSDWLVDEGI